MNKKTEGVMAAIKDRNDLESKKGVDLLDIVEKLSAKRKVAMDKKEKGGLEKK